MSDPNIDDAIAFIVGALTRSRETQNPLAPGIAWYGYELYLPNVLTLYLREVERNLEQYPSQGPRGRVISTTFYEAAWQLCRLGVLRPGIKDSQGHATPDGSSGNGYSVTQAGREWLTTGGADAAFLQVGRLAAIFSKLGVRLGAGFVQRSKEAVLCHNMGAYLACCTMCGACAESILLAVAISKEGDEVKVISTYRSASGRKRVTDMVVGGLKAALTSQFIGATGLLSYWRDDAAHGVESTISEIEAHEALGRLLRFAQFVNDHWAELTGAP
jgi:hypothetical protein